MSNYEMWALIAGFLLPPVEAVIQQTLWPSWLRAGINFIVCCVVALGVVYWQATVDFHNWAKAALTVLVTAIAVYKGLWVPTKIAPKIESATSIKPASNP